VANEVTHALLQTNGGQISAVMTDMLIAQLFDPTDLRQLMRFDDLDGIVGSDTGNITQDAVPQPAAAATSETVGGQSNTAYTTSQYQHTWARYVLQYELTDLLGINGGPVQMQQVIDNLNQSIGLTLTDLLCALFPALANDVGPGTGNDLTVDDIYSAQFQLNSQSVPGEFACVLHPVQINDFQTSLRSETGAQQFVPATADMLALRGPGFKGSWNGINFFQSDSVTLVNSSADRSGAMFGMGCFAYTLRSWRRLLQGQLAPAEILADFGIGFVERDRDATNAMTTAILNMYPSVVEAEDLRGVEIISDA
jgi:hypothetical protein